MIAERFVEEGQNVRAKQPVVRFQDVDEIEIVVDVPETVMAADIQRADIVEMLAELSGAPGVQFPVEVREIAQVADPTTQTFKVRAAMQSAGGRPRAARHDRHRDDDLPPREHPRRPDPGARSPP